jgi:hypothetical protein
MAVSLLTFAAFTGPAHAESCRADVENIGSKLVGSRFFTQWRISHNAGDEKLARVYFVYRIHYKNKRGVTLVERGVFGELLRGAGKQYTKENTSLLDPEDIISVDFDEISCSK